MEDFIHGFCNMDMPNFGVAEYKRGTELTTSLFRQLFMSIEQAKSAKNANSQGAEPKILALPQTISDQEFNVVESETQEAEQAEKEETKQNQPEQKPKIEEIGCIEESKEEKNKEDRANESTVN